MEYFRTTIFCVILFQCFIFDTVTALEDDDFFINPNDASDTLIFAQVVSKSVEIIQNQYFFYQIFE